MKFRQMNKARRVIFNFHLFKLKNCLSNTITSPMIYMNQLPPFVSFLLLITLDICLKTSALLNLREISLKYEMF